ncbi:MAG: hypothetical protein QG564_1849 [Campylobacterota bacterium]|nr:hypothetical protein [Campylobacterota bacterium]
MDTKMQNIDIINEYLKDVNCILKVKQNSERFKDLSFANYSIQVKFVGGGGFTFTVYEELKSKTVEDLISVILSNLDYLKDYDDYDNRMIEFANKINEVYDFLECYEYNTTCKYIKENNKSIDRLKI